MSDLSFRQRHILTWLLERVRDAEKHHPELLETGIWWSPQWKPSTNDALAEKASENAWRASLCRSLARLERRGLIMRLKGRKNARTTRVLLTAEGRKIAESLTLINRGFVP